MSHSGGEIYCKSCGKELFLGERVATPSSKQTPSPSIPGQSPISILEPARTRFSLNTKQLIALWYGALVIIATALASTSTIGVIVAVLIATVATVYTLSGHPAIKKKTVLAWVLAPIATVGLLIGVIGLYDYAPSFKLTDVPSSKVRMFDLNMQLNSACGEITGRVSNYSDQVLKSAKLRIRLSDSTGPIDGATAEISLDVPSGETRSFTGSICGLRKSSSWTWTYDILEIRGD
jgi:hypothetical protein